MARKRDTMQVERDRAVVADLYLRGWSMQDIALHLSDERPYDLTRQQIGYDLRKLREQWLESASLNFNEIQSQELARIDRLEQEYWKGWDRSCQDKESTLVETTRTNGADKEKSRIKRDAQSGDPRFLDGVKGCVELRCKVLGAFAPTKMDIRKTEIDLSQLSPQQLDALASGKDMVEVLSMETGDVVDAEVKLLDG